jgi:transposase
VLKGVMQTTLCCDVALKMLTRYRQGNYNFVMLPGWLIRNGKGNTCMVCAPSLIPRKAGERVKTDRRHAAKLVRSLRAGDLSPVHVPTVEDEAFRDLVRAWGAAKQDLKQARQRPKAFLLIHDVRYTGRADWGPGHRRWISGYTFDSPWQQLAFEEHRRAIEDRLTQCERLEAALREVAPQWRFFPTVTTLQALRGIQFTTEFGLLAELGDLPRFDHPCQLMAWLGVKPSEHSSGEKRRLGGITKVGNSYPRRLLVEAAWSYRHPAKQVRREGSVVCLDKALTVLVTDVGHAIVDRSKRVDAALRVCRRRHGAWHHPHGTSL